MLCGKLQALYKTFPVLCLAHTTGRTCVGRLDKYRIRQRLLYPVHNYVHMLKLCASYSLIPSLLYAHSRSNNFGKKLIHGYAGSDNATTYIRNFCKLKNSLNRSVLTIQTMQYRKYIIHSYNLRPSVLHRYEALMCCIR